MNDQLLDQPVAAEQAGRMPGPSPWEVFWQRKSYIALGAFIGVALGVLYWSMAPKVYESSAQIWVLKKQPDAPISTDPSSMAAANFNASEDFLSTHRTLIHSAVIVGDAVKQGRLDERPAFRNSKRPAFDLARALTITRDRDKSAAGGSANSQILNVSFRCGYPEDCAPVLSSVIASYGEYLTNRTQDSSKQTLDLIVKARDQLREDLETKEDARNRFILKTPTIWKSQTGATLYQERLASIDAQKTALHAHLGRLKATLDEVEKNIKEGHSQAELLDIVATLPGQAPMMGVMRGGQRASSESEQGGGGAPTGSMLSVSLEQELMALQLEEGKLLDEYGPKHPRVVSLRDRLATLRALLAPSTAPEAKKDELRDRVTRAKENLVNLRMGQLKQEVAKSERTLQSLEKLFDKEMLVAREAFPAELQEATYRKAIERSQILYDIICQRLREMRVADGSKGFETQVITPPTEVEKISPRGSVILPLSLVLGLVLGFGLAYLAEFTDKSFRSPEDVRRRLGLSIMGVIPLVKTNVKGAGNAAGDDTQVSPSLFAWHRPKSKEAEAYRAVRTALYFSTHGQGRKLIQVTSPNQGDGKSTTAANLAVSIAQSGKSVLLVDADLRRPHVAQNFGNSNAVGFAAVLGGLAEPDEAICETLVPGLSILPAGATPPNPAELLTSPRLREMLELLRERYDYVIVDTPPLLAVTDPGVVGPQVDGVIMTIRITKKSRVEAKRAKEILNNLGVNIFGVVLNALDQTRSHESYGYYYGYGYYGGGYYKEETVVNEGSDHSRNGRRERKENVGTAHEGNGTSHGS